MFLSTVPPSTLPPPSAEAGVGHQRVSDLQILRGISILMVLAQHLVITPNLLWRFPIKVTMPFYIGVEIFFVISGYIITTILMRDGYSAPRFLLKRAFRLLPPIFVFLGLSLGLNILFLTLPVPESAVETYSMPIGTFLRQAVSVVGGYFLLLGENSHFNGAMWSLSVEDQFYGAIALVMAATGIVLRMPKTSIEGLIGILAAAVFLTVLAARFAILSQSKTMWQHYPPLAYLTTWKFDFIAAGILLAFFDRRVRSSIRAKFADSGPMLCAYALCGIVVIVGLCESPFNASKHYLDGFALPLVCLASCFVVLLAGNGLAFPKTRGPVFRLLERLGDRSYTFYLMHLPIFAAVWLIAHFAMPWAFRGARTYGFVQLIATGIILVPFVELVYRRVELPAIKKGRAIVDRWFPITLEESLADTSRPVVRDTQPSRGESRAAVSAHRWQGQRRVAAGSRWDNQDRRWSSKRRWARRTVLASAR